MATANEKAAQNATRVLQTFFGSAQHGRVIEARVLGREIPIYLTSDGRAWNGLIDLVLEEQKVIIGVDYKVTSKPAMLPAEYAQQERIYSEALRRCFPKAEVFWEFWWLG